MSNTIDINGGSIVDTDGNGSGADLTNISFANTNGVLIDSMAPVINSILIPNISHRVGDVVVATLNVNSDPEIYTIGSGSINGYPLNTLIKINNTTYTANFTITDGGLDVDAANSIITSATLTDSNGNVSSLYNSPIVQTGDAIYSNLPDINILSSPLTINENGGVSTLTANISGSLNNLWPDAINVGFSYSGTATATIDYSKSDSLTIAAGSNSNAIIITAIDDNFFESITEESIIIDIDTLSIGNEGSTNQQSVLMSDDELIPQVTLSVNNNSILENLGTTDISATLSNASYEDVVVNLGFSGTAQLAGIDANTPSSTITILAGDTSATANTAITAIDDNKNEGNEEIIIDITSVSGGNAVEQGVQQKIVSIIDDEVLNVTLSVSANSISETSGSSTITATLDKVSAVDVIVTLAYSSSHSSNGFSSINSITIPSGQLSSSVQLDAISDQQVESDEIITIDMVNVVGGGAQEGGVQQETIILVDDDTVNLSFTVDSNNIDENSGQVILTATLNQATYEDVVIDLLYTGTATNALDYTRFDAMTISSGQTSQTVTITAVVDNLADDGETIVVDIANITGGNAVSSGIQPQVIIIRNNAVIAQVISIPALGGIGIGVLSLLLGLFAMSNYKRIERKKD